MAWVKFGQPFGPQVGRHRRAKARVASRVSWGNAGAARLVQRAQRGRPGEPGNQRVRLGSQGRSGRQGKEEGAAARGCAASAVQPGAGRPPGSATSSRSPAPR